MLDPNEAAFLHSIAEHGDDNTGRLVFADWLDERGESPRAEFVRVQCELATGGLAPGRRHALRVRERELLDTHRQGWCEACGLPVEDVSFGRGLIAGVRLSKWDGGSLLDPAVAPRFATLTELDLSGLRLGDAGLAAFAERARMPALRKLILSDNDITAAGTTALAKATGLPSLDTLYLFRNPVGTSARATLTKSARFRLANLDVGERADGYCMSPGEAEVERRQYVRTQLLPIVARYFQQYERLRSAMLCVAQYWADEADDAVHGTLVVSELFEPTLKGVKYGYEATDVDDPNLPTVRIKPQYGEGSSSEVSLWDNNAQWDDNNRAIPVWAAFAPEGGSQEYGDLGEVYAPAVMFYRHGGYEFLPMDRPHLDGVRPEWGAED
jgi:uncharacterized protein (TIGR02996 family)